MGNSTIFILLSLGANLGSRRKTIEAAIKTLVSSKLITDVRTASYYETEPVGFLEQPWFLNTAISGFTKLPLNRLMEICKTTEKELGRTKGERWHEREIDIDILLYGDKIIKKEKVEVPHPRMHERKFVLVPAAEIAGNALHPSFNLTINQLLFGCKDTSEIRLLE